MVIIIMLMLEPLLVEPFMFIDPDPISMPGMASEAVAVPVVVCSSPPCLAIRASMVAVRTCEAVDAVVKETKRLILESDEG